MPRKFAQKYIVEDRTDGVLRFYFRRGKAPKIPLPGVPGTDEFNEVYYNALKGEIEPKAKDGPKLAVKNTFRWLCEQYYGSAEFKHLDLATQTVRRGILEHCWKEPIKPGSTKLVGDMPVAAFTAKVVRMLRDRKAELPEAGNGRVKAIRQVFKWAIDPAVDHAQFNPARDIAYFKATGDGFHSWTIEEVEKFEERHPIGTKARLALDLLLYTLQRRSDVVLFGKQHVRNGVLKFTQQKNRRRKAVTLEIPIHPNLQFTVDHSPCGDLTYLVTEFKKPFTANGFGNWFRKRCDEAGLPHCSAHGLRKAGSSRMADRGATEHQIMSVTGHQTSKEVNRYTKAARQKVIARTAVNLLADAEQPVETGTKVSRK
ncbi:tyrosine-type recombinase/integrase [Mesorhizobium sp. B2-4-6]|uniref:tyrosine-type recombinase/integrase n=1 Tax=Mesorhizobium sp. B2-4-6 TaxID=2589943 RepID=UPI001129441D|nr:tyrosine-type recombinase/integrase [Mesorhizobium sp. B2-4-6]TPL40631.1 integrase [Mesorhizobium sp. B2-4-6]